MADFPHAAKVLRSTGVVDNVEVADEAWVDSQNALNNDYLYVPYTQGDINVTIGAKWDGTKFIPVQPFPSWTYDVSTNSWIAPVSKPNDPTSGFYYWDEETKSWKLTVLPEPITGSEN